MPSDLLIIAGATLLRRMHGGFAPGVRNHPARAILGGIGTIGYPALILAGVWSESIAAGIVLSLLGAYLLSRGHGGIVGTALSREATMHEPSEIERIIQWAFNEHPRYTRTRWMRNMAALSVVRAAPLWIAGWWVPEAWLVAIAASIIGPLSLWLAREVPTSWSVDQRWGAWEATEGAMVGVAVVLAW